MKRKISFLLIFVFVFTMFSSIVSVNAAATKTKDEAVNWINSRSWQKAKDMDGLYGAQCVDFIQEYYSFLGVSGGGGNACDYAWNTLPKDFTRIQDYYGFVPEAGDIAVWDVGYGDMRQYGHVGLVISADLYKIKIAEVWGASNDYVVHVGEYPYNNGTYQHFWGVIRPKYSSTSSPVASAPTTSKLSVDKNKVAVGETITFTSEGKGATGYTIGINKDGKRIYTADIPSTFSKSFDEVGEYSAYVTSWNNVGIKDSEKIYFTVIDKKDNVIINEEVKDTEIKSEEKTNEQTETISNQLVLNAEIIGNEKQAIGIKFDWNDNSSKYGYRIFRSTSKMDKGISISDFAIMGNEYVDVNINSYETYYYTICPVMKEAQFDISSGTVKPEVLGEYSKSIKIETPEIVTELDKEKQFILMEVGKPTMLVGQETLEIDPGRNTVPVVQNGRTLVPIRAIIEAMGGTVEWDGSQQKVSIGANNHTVEMWLGQKTIKVDGEGKDIDMAPMTINDRTMLPVRFVTENIGCQIEWIASCQQIVIVF